MTSMTTFPAAPAAGATWRKAEHLESTAVGQDGTVPADKPVKPSLTCDQLVTRAKKQMIGFRKKDLCAGVAHVPMQHGHDGALGADGNEGGSLHRTMGRDETAEPGCAIRRVKCEANEVGQPSCRAKVYDLCLLTFDVQIVDFFQTAKKISWQKPASASCTAAVLASMRCPSPQPRRYSNTSTEHDMNLSQFS